MDSSLKETIWQQFAATLDMLKNAIVACQDGVWNNESKFW